MSPVTVVEVAGGLPVIVVGVWATRPMYGVIVYEVIVLPPLAGAVHDTLAVPFPAAAVTPVGAPGAVGAVGVTAPMPWTPDPTRGRSTRSP